MQSELELRKYSVQFLQLMLKEANKVIHDESKQQELRERAQEEKEKLERELEVRAGLDEIKRMHTRALNDLYISGDNAFERRL
ncbi:unnamed protein product [Acanthoscelides obtectus]|uniref:Uncharacterized protein n=1 Tax=Acanthoscelides obtectus TaxID=200917 RepID=A0A9P0P375_ACAOB|nr:unnamed protein product [Acanthoscelides obtectus]CAK1629084.1 hypothetical protein AOBTE_LOCUS5566 [Acanthoscelides obtectus]